jgi:hypothetical protein
MEIKFKFKQAVDVRIDTTKPLAPQIPKNLNLSKGQLSDLTKYLESAANWLKN